MPEVYQQVTDEETGEVTYVAVEADSLPDLLTEEQVRQTRTYGSILDESVRRRKTIAQLKEELEELRAQQSVEDEQTSEEEEVEESDEVVEPQALPSVEELTERIIDQISRREQQVAEEERLHAERISTLITTHGLTEEARPVLIGASDPDETAEYLGRLQTRFDDVGGGELPTTADALESIVQNVERQLGIND